MTAPRREEGTARRLNLYVGAVISVGVIIGGLALWQAAVTGEYVPESPWLAVLFAACMLLAELRPVSWLRRDHDAGVITVSLAYASALLFLLPGLLGALALPAASLAADRFLGVPLKKAGFNAAMLAIMSAVGVSIIRLSDIALTEPSGFSLWALVGIAAACVAMYATNSMLVNTVIALANGRPVSSAIVADFWVSWNTDGILLPLGPILAAVGVMSPSLLPFAMLVTLAVYGSARTAANEQRAASLDPLTGLLNRRRFDMLAEELVDRAMRAGDQVTLAMLDLDGFKDINDNLGHHAGDQVLQAVADRLRDVTSEGGLVARLGGDEFVVLDVAQGGAAVLADRIAAAFAAPVVVGQGEETICLPVRGSVGLCSSGTSADSLGALARAADACMYTAKRTGDPYQIAAPDGSTSSLLHDALAEAVDGPEISCDYQPIVDIRTGALVAFEALARWDHPDRGPVGPDVFIPLAETSSLIGRVTQRVLRDALDALGQFHRSGMPVAMHVNVSAKDLADPSFPAMVADRVDAAGVDAASLVLEITETRLMRNYATANRALGHLRALGVRVALDDFGTGYSSLGHLKDLPLTDVKIDRTFVLDRSPRGQAVLQAFVALATQLGLHTTAEGVEDHQWLAELQQLGFEAAQGYAVGRPMARPEAQAWLEGRQSIERPAGGIITLAAGQP